MNFVDRMYDIVCLEHFCRIVSKQTIFSMYSAIKSLAIYDLGLPISKLIQLQSAPICKLVITLNSCESLLSINYCIILTVTHRHFSPVMEGWGKIINE